MEKQHFKVIALSSLGGALEFYDFVIFVLFAKIIGHLFFPAQDPNAQLMATLGVFAVGYIARPVGGIIFGHFGDTSGRKTTFAITVALMAIPTFLIGLLPTYEQSGILASILLVTLRLLQGLSLGGEIPGAVTFATESVPANRRGFTAGTIFFGVNSGLLLGSLVASLITSFLSETQLYAWGWRIPFFLGGLLGIVSYYLRTLLKESPIFNTYKKELTTHALPFAEAFKKYPGKIISGIFLVALGSATIGLLFLLMPTYLNTTFHYPLPQMLALNSVNIAILGFLNIVAGHFSDKLGRKKVIHIGSIGLTLFTIPLYWAFTFNDTTLVVFATITLSLLAGIVTGCYPSMLIELFPTSVRYSGYAISYNTSFAIFGGLAPLIAAELIKLTGHAIAPSYFLVVIALITTVVIYRLRETYRDVW